jgi:hypothetical protein
VLGTAKNVGSLQQMNQKHVVTQRTPDGAEATLILAGNCYWLNYQRRFAAARSNMWYSDLSG